MAKAAILGFGTVGSGVYEILKNKNLCDSAGEEIEVKYILDIRDFDDEEIKKYLTKDFDVIANDKEIGVVAEVMGGLHPAYEFTKKLLESGVSVVTSNKELVATYGAELLEIARKNNELSVRESELKSMSDTARAQADAAYEIQNQEQQKVIQTATVNAQIARAEREAELK